MKQEIFEKMEKYGWNLGDNEFEDFNGVYSVHYDFINDLYDKLGHADNLEQEKEIVKNINATELFEMTAFVGDFLRALNEIEEDTNFKEDTRYRVENMKRDRAIEKYTRMIKLAKNINNLKEIIPTMYNDNDLFDYDLEQIFENTFIPRMKNDFGIDICKLAEQLNVSTYSYIIKNFAN